MIFEQIMNWIGKYSFDLIIGGLIGYGLYVLYQKYGKKKKDNTQTEENRSLKAEV